jgi:hypothetical protein
MSEFEQSAYQSAEETEVNEPSIETTNSLPHHRKAIILKSSTTKNLSKFPMMRHLPTSKRE